MSNTSSRTARRADDLARYSAAAGALAVALWLIARMLLVYLSAVELNQDRSERRETVWVDGPREGQTAQT